MLKPTMSQQEAKDIYKEAIRLHAEACERLKTGLPISDFYSKAMTGEQREKIIRFWNLLPGSSSFDSAFGCLRTGRDYYGNALLPYLEE